MSLPIYRKFVRDSVIVGLGNLSSQVLSILLIPLVIKLASPAEYGAFVLVSSLLGLATLLFSLGLGFHYRRTLPSVEDPAQRAAVFWPGVVGQTTAVGLGAFVVLGAFPWFGERLLGGAFEFHLVLIPAFCLSSTLNNQAGEFFRYTHRLALYSAVAIGASLFSIGLYLACAAAGLGVNLNVLFGVQVVTNLASGALLWGLILREIPCALRRPRLAEVRQDFRYGFPLTASVFADTLTAASDRYLIAGFLSATAVGLYAPAASVGALILFIPRISSVVLVPLLARGYDRAETRTNHNLLRYSVRLFLLLGLPALAGSVVVAGPVLRLLANAEVAEAGRYVVPVLTAASLVYGLTWILQSMLFVERRTGLTLMSNLTSGAGKVALGAGALLAGMGLTGVAVATLVAQVGGLALVLRDPAVPRAALMDLGFLGKIAWASVVMAAAVGLCRKTFGIGLGDAPAVTLMVLVGIAVYGAGLLVLRVLSPVELTFLREHLAGSLLGRVLPRSSD